MTTGPTYFANAAAFRRWLDKHAATAAVLLVGFRKVGSGKPSITWPESVDEALCFGWIDGVRRRVDDESYTIRFSPRRPGSIWSRINIDKAQLLIEQGRMRPAGLAAFERRREQKSRVYSFERRNEPKLDAAELRAFKRDKDAWVFFEAQAPSYCRMALHWVTMAKRPETRARRLAKLLAASGEGKRIVPG